MKYETVGGQVTRGETYAKLMDHLREAQECAAVLAHLHNTEGNDMDKLLAHGWLGIAEHFRLVQHKVTQMAMGALDGPYG
jgi:hypothetical protein